MRRSPYDFVHLLGLAVGLATPASAVAAALALMPPVTDPTTGLPQGWRPQPLKDRSPTTYVTRIDAGGATICATAVAGASGIVHPVRIALQPSVRLRWSWRVDRLPDGADLRTKAGDDAAARVYVAFTYDPRRVPWWQRPLYELARLWYGRYPPSAGLSYVWATHLPPGSDLPNAYTDRVHVVVLDSGSEGLGRWRTQERDLSADWQRFFGGEPPPIEGIALMTDADDTSSAARACYRDVAVVLPGVAAAETGTATEAGAAADPGGP